MPESAWLVASFVLSLVGMVWLALSLDAHWRQVRGSAPRDGARRILRRYGLAMLALSLLVSFIGNHPSMAPLVWFMQIALAALLVAMLLGWRPRLLGMFAPRGWLS